MTQAERDHRTETLLRRSRQLREELSAMLAELEGFVHALDSFITTPSPGDSHADPDTH